MAWFGKVSLGGLQDLAGAVNKISESVKNIEKNFDTALGLEEKPDSEEGTHHVLFAMALPIPLLSVRLSSISTSFFYHSII